MERRKLTKQDIDKVRHSLHAFDNTAVIRITQPFCNLHVSEPVQPKLKNCLIPF